MKDEETWFGMGIKSGGQLLFGGAESVGGVFQNLANPSEVHTFSITSSRWGLGLGGGFSQVIIGVFKLRGIFWLNGQVLDDFSWNFDLGGKWKHLSKLINITKFFKDVKLAASIGSIAFNLDDIREGMKAVYEVHDFDHNGDHPVVILEVPLSGAGLEVSAFYSRGKIYID